MCKVFKEFADEKHREQCEEFLLSFATFVLAFERVCASMRFLVMSMLRNQGLKNQGMEQVIIGKPRAAELRDLLGALYTELPDQDEDDRAAVKDLVTSIQKLTTERNLLVHSDWHFGDAAAESELTAASFRFKATPSRGATFEEHWRSSSEVEEWTRKAKECQVLLQRLQYCVNQTGFKVSVEFRRSL